MYKMFIISVGCQAAKYKADFPFILVWSLERLLRGCSAECGTLAFGLVAPILFIDKMKTSALAMHVPCSRLHRPAAVSGVTTSVPSSSPLPEWEKQIAGPPCFLGLWQWLSVLLDR